MTTEPVRSNCSQKLLDKSVELIESITGEMRTKEMMLPYALAEAFVELHQTLKMLQAIPVTKL